MIEETAYVIKADDKFAWIETQRRTSCGQCGAQKGCGTKVLAGVLGKKLTHIVALNTAHAEAGDTVIIGMQESSLLKSAVMSYLLPLIFILLGAMIFASVIDPQNEIIILAGALSGFLLSMLLLRSYAKKIKSNPAYQPVVLRKASLSVQSTFSI